MMNLLDYYYYVSTPLQAHEARAAYEQRAAALRPELIQELLDAAQAHSVTIDEETGHVDGFTYSGSVPARVKRRKYCKAVYVPNNLSPKGRLLSRHMQRVNHTLHRLSTLGRYMCELLQLPAGSTVYTVDSCLVAAIPRNRQHEQPGNYKLIKASEFVALCEEAQGL